MTTPYDQAASVKLRRWRADPIGMVRDEFHVEPDAWQAGVLQAFANPEIQRIAMKACKGPGKTAVLAWIIWNFLGTRPESKVGATSITEDNLADNLWAELAKWQARSAFFSSAFTWSKTRIVAKGSNNWFASARTWPKTADAEKQASTLAGIHADYVLFVLDESGGIPQAVMTTAEAVLASGIESKVVQAGNPTHTTGPLHRACTIDRHLWFLVTINGDPDDPLRSPRVSIDWARQQIASWGRDNPWVLVNVFGQFPPASINALLGIEEVEAAMHRHLTLDSYDWAQKRLGVDVARFGDDRSVIFPRQGLASFLPDVMRGARTTEIAARIMVGLARWKGELVLIDDTGHWGHGVVDQLVTAGVPVHPVIYSDPAANSRYRNRRAEMWLKGAEAIKRGAALPPIPELVAELTEPTYTFSNGKFVLEEKDQIKARMGRSPDLADAYMTTYALEDMPGDMLQKLRGGLRKELAESYDPLAWPPRE